MLPDNEARLAARDELATTVLANNRAAGRKIAVAESCTGGMVSAALTDIAGSSDVFSAGFITYSGHAKQSQLDVSSEILETFGEVSLATAWAMAAGALANSDADVAIAITGIAMMFADRRIADRLMPPAISREKPLPAEAIR